MNQNSNFRLQYLKFLAPALAPTSVSFWLQLQIDLVHKKTIVLFIQLYYFTSIDEMLQNQDEMLQNQDLMDSGTCAKTFEKPRSTYSSNQGCGTWRQISGSVSTIQNFLALAPSHQNCLSSCSAAMIKKLAQNIYLLCWELQVGCQLSKVRCSRQHANTLHVDVYKIIKDYDTSEIAVSELKKFFMKSPNMNFTRYVLVIRKQKSKKYLWTFTK